MRSTIQASGTHPCVCQLGVIALQVRKGFFISMFVRRLTLPLRGSPARRGRAFVLPISFATEPTVTEPHASVRV